MDPWGVYCSRIDALGGTQREAAMLREKRLTAQRMVNSLSYQSLVINGEPRQMSVISSDDLTLKNICTIPGERLQAGDYVEWADRHWIISAVDPDGELYARGQMKLCNYLLRWIADDETIVERWCVIEDGTNYLVGEYSDHDFIVTRGDARVSMMLPRDSYTVRLNRDDRFLIDLYDSPNVLAYRLTKPFKFGLDSGPGGVMRFILQECNTEDTDNFELHIANYYDHFPIDGVKPEEPEEWHDLPESTGGREEWF